MRKRYELKDLRLYNMDDGSGEGDSPAETTWPRCGVEFSMMADADLESAGAWPETEVSFAVPESDMPRVQAWFTGDYHGVTLPESPTLRKNMATAVRNALSGFFANATSRNYFTSPVKVGICYRLQDGTLTPMQDIATVAPAYTAPYMPVVKVSVAEKFLYTTCEVRERPARLALKIANPVLLAPYAGKISRIEVYSTAQSPLYDPACEVAGLRDISIDGKRTKCWYYDSYREADVRKAVADDTTFRLLTTIPFDEISGYQESAPLTIGAGTLTKFSAQPRPDYPQSTVTPGASDQMLDIDGEWRPYLHFMTEPLCLSYPEDWKRLRGVTLRGVFDRRGVEMRLYGSVHREGWRLLARAPGAYIRGLAGARYRWFRVEIKAPMRKNDFLEALTFTFSF